MLRLLSRLNRVIAVEILVSAVDAINAHFIRALAGTRDAAVVSPWIGEPARDADEENWLGEFLLELVEAVFLSVSPRYLFQAGMLHIAEVTTRVAPIPGMSAEFRDVALAAHRAGNVLCLIPKLAPADAFLLLGNVSEAIDRVEAMLGDRRHVPDDVAVEWRGWIAYRREEMTDVLRQISREASA